MEKETTMIQPEELSRNKTKRRGIWETAISYTVAAIIGAETIGNNYAAGEEFPSRKTPAHTTEIQEKKDDHINFSTYYNILNKADVDWKKSDLDLIIIADNDKKEIEKIRKNGVKVYMYFPYGSDYKKAVCSGKDKEWGKKLKKFVDNHSHVDGFFWDEMDPKYFGYSNLPEFNKHLKNINEYTQSKGKKTIANGVVYYADHCDSNYYMWESFVGTFAGSGKIHRYDYVDFFQKTWGNDPYDWKNGVATWEYLKKNNALGKTLAHTYGDPKNDKKGVYSGIASKVLGLRGVSYADANNYATRKLTDIKETTKDLGELKSTKIDRKNKTLTGIFENGTVNCMAGDTFDSNVANYSVNYIK